MDVRMNVLPLPGATSFVSGYYGLERCVVRGIVRVMGPLVRVRSLRIALVGRRKALYYETRRTMEYADRENILFRQNTLLLQDTLVGDVHGVIDIPFEDSFPTHEPISAGFGPCNELLPTSFNFAAAHGSGSASYTIEATLEYESDHSILPRMFSRPLKSIVELDRFIVYDKRTIAALISQDCKVFKSAPGSHPVQYDIRFNGIYMGPSMPFNIAYRMLVNEREARRGIRIRSISFTIFEVQIVGEGRCCRLDDDPDDYWHHPFRKRGVREIMNWEHYTQWERSHPVYRKFGEKEAGLYDVDDDAPNNGIFCKGSALLHTPAERDFVPTTPKMYIPPDDHICKGNVRPLLIQIRHSIRITIRLIGGENLLLETGCYMLPFTLKKCHNLIEQEPLIMPTIDYEKEIGLEVWVPAYPSSNSPEVYSNPMPTNAHITHDTTNEPPLYHELEQALSVSEMIDHAMHDSVF